MVSYSEIITSNGVKIPFDPDIITPKIERPMRNNRYEGGECKALREHLQVGDRVLELGAGIGLLSTVAALQEGVETVTSIEANPDLIPHIRETHRLNDVTNIDLRNGVVSDADDETMKFYLRADFWASSMEPDSRRYKSVVDVPNLRMHDLLAELRPTVIVCDIEGAELGLFEDQDLSSVRVMILELHPKVYGPEGLARIMSGLAAQGFEPIPIDKPTTVRTFLRKAKKSKPVRGPRPTTTPTDPRATIITCMKDEGPFILEWVAWHKALGIRDIIVFSNDCSDGTDALLDALAEMGEITHLPNPATAVGSTYFQPVALSFASQMREVRHADYVISMDVDEFIDIRVGDGTLPALLADIDDFDILAMSELNHGSNGIETFQPGWVTGLFARHQSAQPGKHRAARGVKSIVKNGPRITKIRNHRPDTDDTGETVWRDGSGRPLFSLEEDRTQNGIDCRGAYEKVILHHYPLRSLNSYLVKMFRGDVVVKGKQVSQRYWRQRNRDEDPTIIPTLNAARARKYHDRFEQNAEIMALHQACCDAHQARIVELLTDPHFQERKAWILQNAW